MTDHSEHNIKLWSDTAEEVEQVLDKCKLDKWKATCESLNPEIGDGHLWRLIEHIENKQQK